MRGGPLVFGHAQIGQVDCGGVITTQAQGVGRYRRDTAGQTDDGRDTGEVDSLLRLIQGTIHVAEGGLDLGLHRRVSRNISFGDPHTSDIDRYSLLHAAGASNEFSRATADVDDQIWTRLAGREQVAGGATERQAGLGRPRDDLRGHSQIAKGLFHAGHEVRGILGIPRRRGSHETHLPDVMVAAEGGIRLGGPQRAGHGGRIDPPGPVDPLPQPDDLHVPDDVHQGAILGEVSDEEPNGVRAAVDGAYPHHADSSPSVASAWACAQE